MFTILRDAVVEFNPDLRSRLDLLSRTANQRRVTHPMHVIKILELKMRSFSSAVQGSEDVNFSDAI